MVFEYTPVRNDQIDRSVADFINKNEQKQQILKFFKRIKVGVYAFGQKQMVIKADKNQAFVRIGGGFVTIQEFFN